MKRVSLSMITSLLLPLGLAACGGSDDEGEEGPVEGDHSQYVISTVDPRSTNRLDVDGNGMSENKLGDLVAILDLANFMVQATLTEALQKGDVLLLADLQTTSFSASSTAGISFYLGDKASATPAPCTDDTMISTCGKHLAGTGMFSIASTAPRDTLLKGKFAGGTFNAGPGTLAIQIALTGAPLTVNLVGARAQISSVTADGIGKGIVAGAITQTELDANVFPAIQLQLQAVLDRDCGALPGRATDLTTCGCPATSTGASLLFGASRFDHKAPADCDISVEEIKTHPLLITVLKTDVMIDNQPALSLGLGFTAKKATFAR